MPLSLMPRELKFFDMLDETVGIVIRASDKFLALVTEFNKLEDRTEELKAEEHACDLAVGRIIAALDRSFITPIDREDIHTLATSLDDIVDNMEETANRLIVFRIESPTAAMVKMARIIRGCCVRLEEAIHMCRNMRNAQKIQDHLQEVSRLENEADLLYRETESELFADPPDLLTLIKLRELYEWMEETIDSCRDVAHVISEIVIKGS